MRITRLQVAGLRAFKQAELEFTPGMNLLVGINGVGKTTVLDALCICLSKILPFATASRSHPRSFSRDDIRVGTDSLTASCSFQLHRRVHTVTVHKPRTSRVAVDSHNLRAQTLETPDIANYSATFRASAKEAAKSPRQPLSLFFSTRRSLVSDAAPSWGQGAGGQAAAFADSLVSRELGLAEIAHWMRAQRQIASDTPQAEKHLLSLRRALHRFLPDCKDLRVDDSAKIRLLIDKKGVPLPLDVRQLSDGERGLLALVLDLARRLSQANPGLADPVRQGEGVVLIDELDLHLHPKWQRTVVGQLTRTFPRCQFIATTHSPQIVAAVEPERVIILSDACAVRPERSLGMDSNWILRHLMEAGDRPANSAERIAEAESLIAKGAFTKARSIIAEAKRARLALPEWSVLETRIARMEMLGK